MPIVTESQLISTYNSLNRSFAKSFSETSQPLHEAKSQGKVTIFLSHSHSEKQYIEYAAGILGRAGLDVHVTVYVDWRDASMPVVTSGITAAQLKERIKENKKFILLASSNAIKSNWVNWELGYGDSFKYINHIALFPFIKSGDTSWKDAEYLQIYPYIEKEDRIGYFSNDVSDWNVVFPNRQKTKLSNWLKL